MGAEIWTKQKNSTEASVHAKWRTGSAINFVRCHRNYMPSDQIMCLIPNIKEQYSRITSIQPSQTCYQTEAAQLVDWCNYSSSQKQGSTGPPRLPARDSEAQRTGQSTYQLLTAHHFQRYMGLDSELFVRQVVPSSFHLKACSLPLFLLAIEDYTPHCLSH